MTEDKQDKKLELAIEFINELLKTANKQTIGSLDDFIDIDKDDLLSDNAKQVLNIWLPKLFGPFDKKEYAYAKRNQKFYIVTFIRYLAKEYSYELCAVTKKYQKGNSVHASRFYTLKIL